MTTPKLTLISHDLCPFVQRAAIALLETGIPFERRYIDLANKPDWFNDISPLGKVPVLVVNDVDVLFESSAIAQYIDSISGNQLLSPDLITRTRQLAWMEIASQLIMNLGTLYNAADDAAFEAALQKLRANLQILEDHIGDSAWFAGRHFSLVDAAFAPAFRYFDVFDDLLADDLFADLPKVHAWRRSLAVRDSVQNAVVFDYPARLLSYVAKLDSVLGAVARAQIGAPTRAA